MLSGGVRKTGVIDPRRIRSRRPAPLRRRENSKRATDQHQKRSVAYALDRPRRHLLSELIHRDRNRFGAKCTVSERDNSELEKTCRYSCSMCTQRSNPTPDSISASREPQATETTSDMNLSGSHSTETRDRPVHRPY